MSCWFVSIKKYFKFWKIGGAKDNNLVQHVLYFNHCLGAAHSKRSSKSSFIVFHTFSQDFDAQMTIRVFGAYSQKLYNSKTGENIFSDMYFKFWKIWSVKHPNNGWNIQQQFALFFNQIWSVKHPNDGRNIEQPKFFCHKFGV